MAGLVFGKYEKIRRLAEGGMGEVWLARQVASVKGFDRLVILKGLKSDLAQEPGFVEQFLDEARVAATLNHPNIVALYEVGEWGGTFYIAMEYIAGDDLSRLWYAAAKRGVGLPFQVSVKIVHDAALALDHAHHAADVHNQALSIVHRDVSPQNIMVRADGVTKLVDFGIAKAANRVSITKTGTVKGKLQYMSPEQVRGEAVDPRSDQFSLGIVLWEMCTGKRLFKGDTELATLNKILQLPIPTPSSLVPGFPQELERVIQRMLERDRQRRYARCIDVAKELRGYLDRAASANGEGSVAEFVEDILGAELRARTADLTPTATQEGAAIGDGDPGGRTEERPAEIQHTPAVLIKSGSSGEVRRFSEPRLLQQWILDGEGARDDLVSDDGERWELLGGHEDYARFFDVVEAARSVEEEVDRTVSGRIQRASSTRDILVEPSTQSAERDAAAREALSHGEMATQPVPALVEDDEDAVPPAPSRHVSRDDQRSASRTASAEALPVAALVDDDDDDDLRVKGSGARWVLAGMVAVMLAATGVFLFLDEGARAQVLALASGAEPSAVVDDDGIFSALRRDRIDELERALTDVLSSYEAADGRRRAKAAAFASMLASARARQQSGRALALSLIDDEAQRAAREDAMKDAQRFRVDAYKLASEARTLAGDMPEAFLAMASYLAERAAAVEAEADLAGLERALENSRYDEEVAARLLDEARAQRSLAHLATALAGKGDAFADVSDEHAADDERHAWGARLLKARSVHSATPDDVAAVRALVNSVKADASDPRRAALEAWSSSLSSSSGNDSATKGAAKVASKVSDKSAPDAAAQNGADPRSVTELVAAGKRAHADGDSFRAATLFRQAVQKDPRRADAWMGSGWAYIDLGEGEAAVRSFRRAASLPSAPPEALFGLAEAYRFSGEKAQAIKAYGRYLKKAPAGPDAAVAKNALEALKD